MTPLHLFIPGTPATLTAQQKGISWKNHKIYTKAAIQAEEKRIRRNMLMKIDGHFVKPPYPLPDYLPYKVPIYCQIAVVFPLTLEQAQHYADKLSDPKFTLHHCVKPDVDNTAKLLLDILTRMGFWKDDSQVDDLRLSKRYGSDPKLEVWISPGAIAPGLNIAGVPRYDEPRYSVSA